MKKAQGISVNVIIIAALALLVLVVLSVIYIGRMGGWGEKTNDCIINGGTCDYATACPEGTHTKHPTWSCKDSGTATSNNICCIPLKTGST